MSYLKVFLFKIMSDTIGTAAIKFHQAHGSLAELTAGLLAAENFESTGSILTHPDGGLFNTMSDDGNPDAVVVGLGDHWELENISLRLWPSAASLQPVIRILMSLVERYNITPHDVKTIHVFLPPNAYEMNGTMGWMDSLSAWLSARYVTSVILHDREFWLRQFDSAHLNSESISDFARTHVEIDSDPLIGLAGEKVEIITSNGNEYYEERTFSQGDASELLSDVEKFKTSSFWRIVF